MGTFAIWISSILAIVIIGVLADLLLSGNRMHNFVRGIFGVVALFVIISPLPSLIKNGFDFNNGFDWSGGITIDQDYIDSINQKKINMLEKGVEDLLSTNGYKNVYVKIDATVDGVEILVKNATVDITSATLNGTPDGDMYKQITSIVANALLIESINVIILG